MDACEGYVSKESVLDIFAQWHGHDVCDFNRAIKELPSVNPTEQEAYDKGYKQGYADRIEMEKALRVEDCISREAVHDLFATWLSDYITDETRETLETIEAKIEDLPSVKPTRTKVLDKIRAEIEQERVGYPPSADYYKAIMKCLQIIDKYKAESEVEE